MEKRDRIDLCNIYELIKSIERLSLEDLKQQREIFEQALGVTIVDILITMKDEKSGNKIQSVG